MEFGSNFSAIINGTHGHFSYNLLTVKLYITPLCTPFDGDFNDITFHKLLMKVTKFPVAAKLGYSML